jgi:hypothetical protein
MRAVRQVKTMLCCFASFNTDSLKWLLRLSPMMTLRPSNFFVWTTKIASKFDGGVKSGELERAPVSFISVIIILELG